MPAPPGANFGAVLTYLHKTTPRQVERVLARHPNARGAAKLRRVLRGEARVTHSKPERRFLELLRENGLPLPQTNRVAGSTAGGPSTA